MATFMGRYDAQTYAALRIVTGLLFLWHGAQKLVGFPKEAPAEAPAFVLYVAGPIELVGGVLVLVGLFTRWAAFVCSGLMAFAYWLAHGTQHLFPLVNGGELAAVYCFVFLFISAHGAGLWSLDAGRASAQSAVLLFKNLLFTAVVPGTVAVYLPLQLAPEREGGGGVLALVGGLLLALGASIYTWCVYDFATFGRGTPAPIDAPKRLVERGLYRLTRNPMYLGVLTTLLGWAAWYQAPTLVLYALCVGILFHGFVVFYEEPHLAALFGRSYDDYRARVGRWLPRLAGAGRAGTREP